MRISVVTAVLNRFAEIERTVRSVLLQDYPNVEYIVIDGGSTDGTMDVLCRYRDRISVLVSEPDAGLYSAMNKGISRAGGEIVCILSAGDWFLDCGVLSFVAEAMRDGTDMLAAALVQENPNGYKLAYSEDDPAALVKTMNLMHPATFVRKDAYLRFGLFDERYRCSADHELMIRLRAAGCSLRTDDRLTVFFGYGGVSADPRRHAYREDRAIAAQYGVPKRRAALDFYLRCARFTLISLIRKLHLDALAKRLTGRAPDVSAEALRSRGIDVLHPWCDAAQEGRR